jgi:hypothetical protein
MVARDGVEPPTVAFFRAALYRMPRTHLLLLPGGEDSSAEPREEGPEGRQRARITLGARYLRVLELADFESRLEKLEAQLNYAAQASRPGGNAGIC